MEMVSGPRQDEVWLVSLDPTRGAEMQKNKTLPGCVAGRNEPASSNRDCRSHDHHRKSLPYASDSDLSRQTRTGGCGSTPRCGPAATAEEAGKDLTPRSAGSFLCAG